MDRRRINDNVEWLGALDWERRLFDSLIPLPDGTSYNAYLIRANARTALLDTVDPPKTGELMRQLEDVPALDFLISHHAEQDHSGAIPAVLDRYPGARLVCTEKAKGLLMDHLAIENDRFMVVHDGQSLDLGGKTLIFLETPWVHWPETMVTYLAEDRILFTCDFFGSHLASSDLFASDEARVHEAAKRYYAEIMMPFRRAIERNLQKLDGLDIRTIAPSHGPVYDNPSMILDAYRHWAGGTPQNLVVLPYVSMHGSTRMMVDRLVAALIERGVAVQPFDLAVTDIGKLAMSLVDAATIVIGTPTVLTGPHPLAAYCASLANALRPKARFLSVIGSFGWSGRAVETLSELIPHLKVEVLDPVLSRGLPREDTFAALDRLAADISERHAAIGTVGLSASDQS